ncbi:S41 family peptidase [uncultured Pigmentiphaga sp.]|jgi:C-terminal peptidase (prc)|uniref:S41 family peptidase n=1 Tax=uncultured Pigmentiphaga sp. TaxID=340361 RepID=UPI00262E9E1A|nr:S41 family peptidase [uncultured Pigmentiphaga sp.]
MGSKSKVRSFGLVSVGIVAGVLISLGITAVAQKETRGPLPLEELRQFSTVFATIKNNYVEPVEDKKLIDGAIAGMLSDLDPHSAYLDAEAYREMQTATQGEFGGLGIEVGTEDGFVKVIAPIEDTPAARAGVKAGDLIVKIDDKSTKGLLLNDAVKLMRGKPKTSITLTLVRKNEPQPIVVTIERDIIKVQSVRSKMLEDHTAYVRIAQFQEQTGADLAAHLERLGKNGPPKALILDLRNDPGGLLHSAIAVSAAFLPQNTLVVSTDGRTPDAKRQYKTVPSDYLRGSEDYIKRLPAWTKTVPMVVLVNAGSASASEIVAGALQDQKRAKVLGAQTFGKGSVQVILPISRESAIKLTTSRYYTPSGRSIQAKGIVPDYPVTDTPEGDLYDRPREADLAKHLLNDKDPDGETKSAPQDPAKAAQRKPVKPIEFGGPEDFQLAQALNLLAGKPVQLAKAEEVAKDAAELAERNKTPSERAREATQDAKKPAAPEQPTPTPAK